MIISTSEARDLIERTFTEFISYLRRNKRAFSNPSMPYAFRALIMDLPEWASAENPDDMDYLFDDLSVEDYNYLLQQCFKLATGYRLSTRDRLAGATVENRTAPSVSQGGEYRAILAQSFNSPWQDPFAVQNPQIPRTPEDQMAYLKRRYAQAVRAREGREKGRIAAELRVDFLRSYFHQYGIHGFYLDGLFSIDKPFMNKTLRDFLNVNENGIDHYIFAEVQNDSDWSEAPSFASVYHQSKADTRTILVPGFKRTVYSRLNAKFTHRDGREAVFRPTEEGADYIADGPDKGTYNYVLAGTNFSGHHKYDIEPFDEKPPDDFNPESANFFSGKAIFNLGIYRNSYYWRLK